MADKTGIEWTDATWNPLAGCSIVSPACTNCYAMAMAARIERMNEGAHKASMARDPEWGAIAKTHYAGLTAPSKAGPVWTGKVALAPDQVLTKPLHWKRPRRIFVNSMSDLFHESVPDEWIDRIFAVMALAPQHTFQVLTKRAKRMREYLALGDRRVAWEIAADPTRDDAFISRADYYRLANWQESVPTARVFENRSVFMPWPLSNVWLGVTAEDATRFIERVHDLRATPAAKHFISYEPALGSLDGCDVSGLDWVIAGGESGPNARPSHPDWFRSLRDQCAAAGVPFFFKQWGEWETALDREKDDHDWRADYSNEFAHRGKMSWINLAGGHGFHGDRFHVMRRLGKRRAGSLLDGREHKDFPA